MCDLVTQLYTHHGWQSDSEAQTSQTNEAMNDDKIRADEKDDRTCQSRDVSVFFLSHLHVFSLLSNRLNEAG